MAEMSRNHGNHSVDVSLSLVHSMLVSSLTDAVDTVDTSLLLLSLSLSMWANLQQTGMDQWIIRQCLHDGHQVAAAPTNVCTAHQVALPTNWTLCTACIELHH